MLPGISAVVKFHGLGEKLQEQWWNVSGFQEKQIEQVMRAQVSVVLEIDTHIFVIQKTQDQIKSLVILL